MLKAQLQSIPEYTTRSSRLPSLYSDFSRQKQSNPISYNSNVDWWHRTLSAAVSQGWLEEGFKDRIIIHAEPSLAEAFRLEGNGKPLALNTVISELSSSRKLFRRSDFLQSARSIYYIDGIASRLASAVVRKPFWWALQQLSILDDEPTQTVTWKKVQGEYVIIQILEKAADAVIAHEKKKPKIALADSLHDLDSFAAEYAPIALPGVTLSRKDIEVLVKYLERDKQVIVTEKDVVKFISDDEALKEVTVVDHGVLEMTNAVRKLQSQIKSIQERIEERTNQIKQHLKVKRRDMALSYLRSRKQLEELLPKRLRSLETLQSTLDQVENARYDIEIMKAYETSTSTLRAILSHPSLQRENIDATMESMAEANADFKEVDDAIRFGLAGEGVTSVDVDEDELASELEALVKERELEEKEEMVKKETELQKETSGKEREQQQQQQQKQEVEFVEPVAAEIEGTTRAGEDRREASQADSDFQSTQDRRISAEMRAQWEGAS